ncbi:MAG: exo-alpha-sialidase [Bryobacteraceae bacterium]|nr:exo-alpha-sialidase [Bryobacteraceae bacterium]
MKVLYTALLAGALSFAGVHSLDTPAGPESGMPFLATGPDGAIYLSWIDPVPGQGHALRFSKWAGKEWAPAETIATGKNWFVNWADFPAIAALPDGSMLAHWLTRSADGGAHGYGIRIAMKQKSTSTWREVHGMSLDEKEDYAGFLSFVPNSASAIYLSPPAGTATESHGHDSAGEGSHRKTVRYVSFRSDGSVAKDLEVDTDACSCCQTAIGVTRDGLIAAYRDHLPGEIRDISFIRLVDGVWSKPKTLHEDGWKINGCPTEGPSIATNGNHVGVAWMTRAADKPRVQTSLSQDGGKTFDDPIRIDDGDPLGRPSLAILDNQNYAAVWLEKTEFGRAQLRIRRIAFDGTKSPSLIVSEVPSARSTGFPKLAVTGNQILLAWRDGQVRTAFISKDQLVVKDSK